MTQVKACAAPSEATPVFATIIERREVGPQDVQFHVLFCGICHSDIHTVRGEWGKQTYPLAPGHELAGKVMAVGEVVTKFKVGDRVGVGCLVYTCLECEPCKTGHEQFCGGLGHVGLKLAKAMGAEVSILSHTDKKCEDALKMGAVAFHKMDQDAFAKLTVSYDLILNTVSATVDNAAYFNLLKFDGVFVVIGADPSPFVSISTSVGVTKQRVFSLSLISGVQETQNMLNFCGEHNLLPEIEFIPASYINEAYDRVVSSDVRYRFVIDNSTM
jgi:D-arabinose 1-dehydrogenase-like Zn-dependent alcohol dehydrogenase